MLITTGSGNPSDVRIRPPGQNDHLPSHIHVFKRSGEVRIELGDEGFSEKAGSGSNPDGHPARSTPWNIPLPLKLTAVKVELI